MEFKSNKVPDKTEIHSIQVIEHFKDVEVPVYKKVEIPTFDKEKVENDLVNTIVTLMEKALSRVDLSKILESYIKQQIDKATETLKVTHCEIENKTVTNYLLETVKLDDVVRQVVKEKLK